MNRDETLTARRVYSRGYFAGSKGAWPEHRPPLPPDAQIATALRAARSLRDAIDGQLATFGEDDEVAVLLGPLMDAFDNAMADIGKWVREAKDAVHA